MHEHRVVMSARALIQAFDASSFRRGWCRRIGAGALIGLFSSALHCSVLWDPPAPRQCDSDADCAALSASSGTCDPDHGVCVSSNTPVAENQCQSTALCTQINSTMASLCRYPGSPCVRIETADCPRVTGNWRAPNALILGSIGPHTFGQVDGSEIGIDYIERSLRAIDLAIGEWEQEVPGGLSFSRRPIAMVHCNSRGEDARARAIMTHLVDEVRVPVVLAMTDVELGAIASQAAESGIAVVCTECYSRAQAVDPAAGLVWRMLPPFEGQAPLAAWRVRDLESKLRAERGLAADAPIRVATLSDDRPAFNAFIAAFRDLVRFNGDVSALANGASYLEVASADPRVDGSSPLAVARRVVDFAPDILVVAVDDDFTRYHLRMIEQEWNPLIPRPYYVATLLNEELGLFEPIVAGDDELRRRVSGTGLSVDAEVARNSAGFRLRYQSRYGEDPGRTQTSYDAFYATALAIFASDVEGTLAGAHIATMFERLGRGPLADVAPSTLANARAYLIGREPIDLVGNSSQLQWSPLTQQLEADWALWCLVRGGGGSLELLADTGLRWTVDGVIGSYECP